MQLVVSRKHMSHNANQALDLEALSQAMVSSPGSVSIKAFPDSKKDDIQRHIELMTANGYVCHTFKYGKTFQSTSNLVSTRATA
jgi:hypothetical protein